MFNRVNAWDSVPPINAVVCNTPNDVRALAKRMARRPVMPIVHIARPALPIEFIPEPKPEPFLFPHSEPYCHRAISLMWTIGRRKRVTIHEIMHVVAERYGVSIDDIKSDRRNNNIVRPRQVAMYLSRKLTPRSFPEIGRRFGGRDHSTVWHALNKIETLMQIDPVLAGTVDDIRRGLLV